MSTPSIYYLIPDIQRRDFSFLALLRSIKHRRLVWHLRRYWFTKHRPVGGIKVAYQHCNLLQEHGLNAYPLIEGDYIGNFYGFETEIKHKRDVCSQISERDIVVVPEYLAHTVDQHRPARCVLFVQNHRHLYSENGPAENCSYTDLGYEHILYCSRHIGEQLTKEADQRTWFVSNFIDHTQFKPAPQRRQHRRILAMWRKNPEALRDIKARLNSRGIEIVTVDGLSQDELIVEYQKSDVFLAVSAIEGFGLPPLEAMACGCAIVGFTGGGGSEFMIDRQTALVAKDGDNEQLVNNVVEILQNEDLKDRIRVAGQKRALEYNQANTAASLVRFFQNEVGASKEA